MAIAALLIGGAFGFVSFLISLLALDHGLAHACLVYFGTGVLTFAIVMMLALLSRRTPDSAHGETEIRSYRVG